MIIKQLSVFLENRAGRLHEVFETLGRAGINVSACSVADTSEFGILRLIVSEPDKARSILKDKSFSVNTGEVVSFSTANMPGALSSALDILSRAQIGVEYLYGFSIGDKSFIALRPDDPSRAIEAFQKHNLDLVSTGDLSNF